MTEKYQFDEARRKALKQIEKSERNFKLGFFGALLVEGLFLAGFVIAADFRNNALHFLLFISTIATYTIIALGLLALGAHVSRNTQLILKAIELLDENGSAHAKNR